METPYNLPDTIHVYHQYTIKCNNRKDVIEKLKQKNVGFGIYYPKPMHMFNHLKSYGHSELKISEKLSNQVLSLPVHPNLTEEDLHTIISCF